MTKKKLFKDNQTKVLEIPSLQLRIKYRVCKISCRMYNSFNFYNMD